MKVRINSKAKTVFTKRTIPLLVAVATLILLLAASTLAFVDQGGTDRVDRDPTATEIGLGPNPFFNHRGPGADFIKAGVTTRVYNPGTGMSQSEPFVLTVPALPAGANVVETFVSWNYLLDGTPPINDAILVNGNAVTGSRVGTGTPDLCWAKDGFVSYMAAGVTPFVNPGAAPVAVTIAGATDKPLGADPNAYGEGLTILVVYDVPVDPWRNVDLYNGYTSTESGPAVGIAAATLNYTVLYQGGDFHFFLNGPDGQQIFTEVFLIDGISRGGQVNGTVGANNAWHGLLGPAPVDNVYDHANDDISAFLTPPDPSLNISTDRTLGSDCVGHSFAAISFPAERPAIPTLTEWGLIIFGLILIGFITWVFLKRRKAVVS